MGATGRQVYQRGTILRVLKLCLLAFILPVGIDVAYAAGIASDKESVLAIHSTTLGIFLKLLIFVWILSGQMSNVKKVPPELIK